MNEKEKTLWDLFCMTGEPRYYSMYAEEKRRREDRDKK